MESAAAGDSLAADVPSASSSPAKSGGNKTPQQGKTMQKKAKSSPSLVVKPAPKKEGPPAQLLRVEEAWKSQALRSPVFSVREKLKDPDLRQKRPGAYSYAGNLTRNGLVSAPSWSMNARATGLPSPPQGPAPGHYKQQTTMYMDHPTMHNDARCKISDTGHDPDSLTKTKDRAGPGPHDYQTAQAKNYEINPPALTRQPGYTIREKPTIEVKRATGNAEFYQIEGWHNRTGTLRSASWTMLARATGIPSPPTAPGPGHYPLPGTVGADHPTMTVQPRMAHANACRVEDKPLYPSRPY